MTKTKEEKNEYQRKWREQHRERYRELVRTGQARYKKTIKGKITEHRYKASKKSKEYNTRYNMLNRKNVNSHTAVYRQIKRGVIERSNCKVCNKPNALAHHPNYDEPLSVEWLCAEHHSKHHNQIYGLTNHFELARG